MSALNRQQIRRLAISSGSSIDLLKSEAVAAAVVSRLKAHLGNKMPVTIDARPSSRHPGTWRVDVYRLPLVGSAPAASQINKAEADKVKAAVKAVFRAGDLVTSWQRPS